MIDPKDRPEQDPFGVGMNADGTLDVVPPADMARRVAERDAEEDDASEEDDDDIDDLGDLDDIIEKVRDL